jgi:protein-disulfide isomerase
VARFPHFALAACLVALTACSPACTPPDAKSPDSGGKAAQGNATPGDDAKASPKPVGDGEMVMEAKGVDLSQLSESQRTTFFQIINTEPSACDKPHSLAKSLRDDASCRDSLIAAQFVADRVASGATPSGAKQELQLVVSSLQPKTIPTEGRPMYGSERAPVTLVVFADFECPGCAMEAPALRKAVDQFRGRVKLVFKHFPITGHERAKPAAIATEAAHEQGKFWEMAELVFQNQMRLSDEDLYRYAERIGLDMAAFKASYEAKKGLAAVERDRKDGEEIDIPGTPAVYVNGRQYSEMLFGGSIAGWIDDALKR